MTTKKQDTIELNYINGNISDAKKLIKSCSVQDRKELAIDAMYRTYLMEQSNTRIKAYDYAKFLIESI